MTAFNLVSSDLPAQLRPAATRCFVCCTRLLIQVLGRCGRLLVSWLPLCLHIVPGASAALARHPVCRLRMLVADTKSDGRRLACGHRGLQQVRLQFSCMPVEGQREAGSSARHCRRCRVPTKRPPGGGRARSGRLPTSLTVGERCFLGFSRQPISTCSGFEHNFSTCADGPAATTTHLHPGRPCQPGDRTEHRSFAANLGLSSRLASLKLASCRQEAARTPPPQRALTRGLPFGHRSPDSMTLLCVACCRLKHYEYATQQLGSLCSRQQGAVAAASRTLHRAGPPRRLLDVRAEGQRHHSSEPVGERDRNQLRACMREYTDSSSSMKLCMHCYCRYFIGLLTFYCMHCGIKHSSMTR